MSRARNRDDGAASLYVLWLSLVVLAVGLALAAVGGVRVARARAASAADLAALSGAAAAGRGDDACDRAREIALRGGATRTWCSVDLDGVVTVEVEVALGGALARFGSAAARALAGPAGLAGEG